MHLFAPEFALVFLLCLLPLPVLWGILRWRRGGRAPSLVRVMEFASLSAVAWFDFTFTPTLYLLPRMLLPLGHPAWRWGTFAAYLTQPVHSGGVFGTVDQWWVSAVWLLLHRPEQGWGWIQFFWLLVALPTGWATARGGWRYGPREPRAALAATHGSSRWRRPGELAHTLRRLPCDQGERREGVAGRAEDGRG